MCCGARFGQGPVLAILSLLAPKVALGGCVPLLSCVARRCGNIVRSGRESRHVGRTGKLALGRSRLDDGIAFWIERDLRDRRPVAGLAAPSARVGPAGLQVEFALGREKRAILLGMALRWVTYLMPLCRCSLLYPWTNRVAQSRAVSRSAKSLTGKSDRYLALRNTASA